MDRVTSRVGGPRSSSESTFPGVLKKAWYHSTWAASWGYRFLSLLCLDAWWLVPRCSCILVSSTLFGRSPALGTIVVQGLGLLRMFVSLIFFLQLCQYHPVCHYFYGARGDGYFYQSECIEAFYWFFALCFAEVWNSGVFCTCARVLLLRWS